jgi:hypothetical protein
MLPPGVVRDQKRENASETEPTAAATGWAKERKQHPHPKREPQIKTDLNNRTNEGNRIRTNDNVAGKSFGGRSERAGIVRGGQAGRSGLVARDQRDHRDQRDPKINSSQQSGSSLAGRENRPPISQGGNAARSNFSGQGNRIQSSGDRNRERGQDRAGRFNRGDAGNRGERGADIGGKRPKSYVATPKPKELKPITEKMKQGKEPLRSFGDLAQLWGRVQVAETADEKKQKKEPAKNKEK